MARGTKTIDVVVSAVPSGFEERVRDALAEALDCAPEEVPAFDIVQVDPPGHEVADEPQCYVTVELKG